MATNTRIKANTINDLLGVQALAFCISVQLIEVSNTQCKISIGEQLNCLGLGEAHEQCVDVLLDSTFLQQTSKLMCSFYQTLIAQVSTNDDAGRIQVIVKSLGFTQEFRAENDILAVELLTNRSGVTNRNRRLDNHDGVRIVFHDQLDHSLDSRCIKMLRVAVVVGRGRDYNKICIRISSLYIQGCSQIQILFCQIFFNVVILNRRFPVVDHLDLLRNDIHSSHMMMLGKQGCNRQTNITCSGHSNFIVLHSISPPSHFWLPLIF